MKLQIKANDRKVKVDCDGKSMDVIAGLLSGIHILMRSVSENEEGFENAKRILSSGVQCLNYDGSTNNELFAKLIGGKASGD